MKELVVISGKGGTGKTSIVASLAVLAKGAVLADCDVDAADLHLVLEPNVLRSEDFVSGAKAHIVTDRCTSCGRCAELCRFDAIISDECDGDGRTGRFRVDPLACEGCGVCVDHCEPGAIEFPPAVCGQWFVSDTRVGPMVHARLGVAAENSGKLVTHLRRVAQEVAQSKGLDRIICDGSPGIGCPVIASLTGASLALIVVEPTVSGLHDFDRIAQLCFRLGVPAMMAVNKSDLNAAVAERLESAARRCGVEPIGRVPYDSDVTRAQVACRSLVEVSDGPAARAVAALWPSIEKRLKNAMDAGQAGQMGLVGQIANPS